MKDAQKELAVVAVEMILKHGVPFFMQAMRDLQTDNPTIEQIRALKGSLKSPESYFDQGDDTNG